jgi:hypothetical protein
MKRLAALGATAALVLLGGCTTEGGHYSSGYGYGGYPAYAYNEYSPYYDGFGYPYGYSPARALGFGYYDYDGRRNRQHAGGFSRPHGPP